MQKSGYSMIEMFGVVALVLTLAVVAIPSIRNFSEGGKQGSAVRNASALNSAVQQFDQSGGLLTARVPVPSDVASIKDKSRLPELAVLNLLRGGENGGQVSSWQEPIFDDKGYRVVWTNPLQNKQTVREGLSGDRSIKAEQLVASGDGGRFEVINDDGGRMGIVGFQRGDLMVAALEFESPTPAPGTASTPATANSAPSASLSVTPASAVVGETFTYIANGTDPDNDPIAFAFTHTGGTEAAGNNRVFSRSYPAPGTYTVTVNVSDGALSSQAQATVTVTASAQAPTVTLSGSPANPHRGQTVTFTADGIDPEGKALTYRFIQDGAVVQQGPSNVFSTTYSTLGGKTVTVVAIDPDGLSGSADALVSVTNREPIVGELIATPNKVARGQDTFFSVSAQDPDIEDSVTVTIDGEAANPVFRRYSTLGVKSVSATITDGIATITRTGSVEVVNLPPTVTLTVDKVSAPRGDQFTFTAAGNDPDGDPIQYSFKVGTDANATWSEYADSGEFKQSFTTVGEKTVTARVRDSLGAVNETTPVKINVVNRAPSVVWVQPPAEGFRNREISFLAQGVDPDGDVLQYRFRQTNGQWSEYGAVPRFNTRFSTEGSNGVQVQARDTFGLESTVAPFGLNILIPPEYLLRAQVVVQGGSATPDQVLRLSGISIQGDLKAADETHAFSFTPAAGWVIDSVTGATGYTHSLQNRFGSTASILLNDDKVVVFTVKPRPIVYYWNETMPAGRGNAYPAARISEAGMSFRAAAARGGHSSATLGSQLGVVNWTTASWRYAPGQSQLTGWARLKLLPNADVGHTVVIAQGHKYIWKWRTTKIHTAFNYARSSNIVMLDGESGELLAAAPAVSRPSLGATYGTLGVISGVATGSEDVAPVVSTTHNDSRTIAQGSPVAVDLNGNGQLDLLSGQDWRKSPERAMVSSAFRKFKLDGENEKLWEWISNEDGLLVFNPDQAEVLDVTGKNLFGNYTFGEQWLNGYEPLATLDTDGNGLLEGLELAKISVWKDENMDAKVQKGELLSTKSLLVEYIAVKPSFDKYANTMVEQGVLIGSLEKDGPKTALATWDWISYGGLPTDTKLSDSDFFNSLSAYKIKSAGLLKDSHLCFAPTEEGYRVFWTIQPNDYTEKNAQFSITGDKLEWSGEVEGGKGQLVKVKVSAKLGADGNSISGITTFEDGRTEDWTGSLITGLPLSALNVSF